MTGLFLIPVAIVWLLLALAVTGWVARRFNGRAMKVASCVLSFPLLLAAPLIDELVGRGEFEQLCKDNSTIQVDRSTAGGRTVYLAKTSDVELNGTWVHVVLKPWRFVDARTGETVVSYKTLNAGGGWLIRHLGISEGGVPLTFKGYCDPGGVVDPHKLFSEIGITQIQRANVDIKGAGKASNQ